jgi:hypothetical protein
MTETGLPTGVELSVEGQIRTTIGGCYGMNMTKIHLGSKQNDCLCGIIETNKTKLKFVFARNIRFR